MYKPDRTIAVACLLAIAFIAIPVLSNLGMVVSTASAQVLRTSNNDDGGADDGGADDGGADDGGADDGADD